MKSAAEEVKLESSSQKLSSPTYATDDVSEEEDDFAEAVDGQAGSELSNIKRIINEYKALHKLYKTKIEEKKQKVGFSDLSRSVRGKAFMSLPYFSDMNFALIVYSCYSILLISPFVGGPLI